MAELLRRSSCVLALLAFAAVPGLAQQPATARVHSSSLAARAHQVRPGARLRVESVQVPATSETFDFELERFDVFTPDAEIVVHGAGREQRLKPPANAYFRGALAGQPGSKVFLAVQPDGRVQGIVTRQRVDDAVSDESFLIDSAEARRPDDAPGLRAERADAALVGDEGGFECAQDELAPPPAPRSVVDFASAFDPAAGAIAEPAVVASAAAPFTHTARVAIETDFEYYQKFNNVTNATNYAANLIGYASLQYQQEISTSLAVSSLSLWTTSSDPWSQTSTLCGLMEFGRYWNKNNTAVSRTIAHFLSGKNLGGGIAWVGVLCSSAFATSASCPGVPTDASWGGGYGFTANISGTFNVNSPTVMWDIVATSHEIGHNFNSPHTHCYNGIGGNANPVDQCRTGESGCYAGTQTLPGPAGSGSGTTMSYCHLLGGGFGNISLSFGTGHPFGVAPGRVATRMTDHVISRAASNPSCLAPIAAGLFSHGFEGTLVGAGAWAAKVP